MHVADPAEAERRQRALDGLALGIEDPGRLPEMCERLLANPLIEDYEIVEAVVT